MAEYHIIGGDGREYGPYSEEEIKELMADGRLKASSGVRVDDGEWKPYSEYPELGESMPATLVRVSGNAPSDKQMAARSRVKIPATFMIVLSAYSIMKLLLNMNALIVGGIPPENEKTLNEYGIDKETLIVATLLTTLFNTIILGGAINMRKGRYYGLAMVASVLCILCNSSPYGLGLIAGVWSIVVLNKPEVKMEFR
jgi:hypothetical protein